VHWAVGIDLAEPSRLAERMQRRPSLAEELFTAAELAYCRRQFAPEQSFAGRFAAKEAVVKALELDGWDPLDIEILEGDPAPRVRLHGGAAAAARSRQVDVKVSLTHLPELAAAVALVFPVPP
jgi:holo-[acyl-carrier protein] synthase